jgi:hypothetical protein
MSSNSLPLTTVADSAQATKLFFDQYGISPLEFSANEVSAAVGFFESKGFSTDAALTTASAILKQAKIDGIPVFKLLDTLKGFDSLQLSALVSEILNNNRKSTSTLGFRYLNIPKTEILRNISP